MIYFTAHTFKCVCHCRRAMFRVLGMYNFGLGQKSLKNFRWFLVETMTPKRHFEINWPLKNFEIQDIVVVWRNFIFESSQKPWKLVHLWDRESWYHYFLMRFTRSTHNYLALASLSQSLMRIYGNTGCRVFKRGVQN